MLSKDILNHIETGLSQKMGSRIKVQNLVFVGGGCINNTGRLETNHGNYFIKWNHALTYPKMLEKEKFALEALQNTGSVNVPEVILQDEYDKKAYLIMEYIEQGKKGKDLWVRLGSGLASLHMNTFDRFGFEHDNYIGHLPQINSPHVNWFEFFIENRLKYQSKLAYDKTLLTSNDLEMLGQLYLHLPSLLPEENPALLHGDLWSGNFLVDQRDQPILIDPSVYYGHREVDLSMMKLFGGFDEQCFESYNEAFPLQPGFNMRVDLYNIYPLLVHLNLFGISYINALRSILRKYS